MSSGFLDSIKTFFETEEQKIVTDSEKAATIVWGIIVKVVETEAPQLPGLILQGVLAGANAKAGANKKDVAIQTILTGLKDSSVASVVNAASNAATLTDISNLTGLSSNSIDNAITSGVAFLRAKGVIK